MTSKICKICGSKSGNYDLCKDCYYEKENYSSEFFNAFSKNELIDYYNNLKYYIFKIKNEEVEISAYLKLVALSEVLFEEFDSSWLTKKVYDDIKEIQTKKTNYKNSLKKETKEQPSYETEHNALLPKEDSSDIDQSTLDYRLLYPMTYHCEDGHYVRSPFEQQIDDYLTSKKIIHYYEKRYKNYDTGETYYPDWFLPEITDKGVYIECFGKSDEKYKEKTDKKIKFYKKENINLIEIYPKHMNNFKEILDDEIEKFKRKH